MKKRKNICLVLTVFILFIFFRTIEVLGGYIEVDPQFSWTIYYEDNIEGSGNDEVEDFSNRYQPNLDFNINLSQLSISGSTEAEIIEYMDEKSFNTVNQDHHVTATFTPNRRSKFLMSGGYSVEIDPDRYFEAEESFWGAERGYTVKRYKEKTKFCTVGSQYVLSQRSNLAFLCTFSNFETGVTDGSDFYVLSLDYTFHLNPKTALTVNCLYNFFDFDFGGKAERDVDFLEDIVAGIDSFDLFGRSDYELDNYNISCGLTHDFSEDLKLDLSIGWRYTETDRDIQTVEKATRRILTEGDNNNGDGIIFALTLNRKFFYTRMQFSASQNIGINPDSGASYENRRFTLSVSHDFSQRLKGRLSLTYHTHDADRDEEFGYEVDRDIFYISPNITYEYHKWLMVVMGYRFSRNENDISNIETERNTFYFMFRLNLLKPYILK